MSITITLDGKKRDVVTATGPSADVSVGGGTATNISLAYGTTKFNRITRALGVKKISGLPDGIVLVGFEATESSVVVRVYNVTTATITISSNSVSVDVEVEGF